MWNSWWNQLKYICCLFSMLIIRPHIQILAYIIMSSNMIWLALKTFTCRAWIRYYSFVNYNWLDKVLESSSGAWRREHHCQEVSTQRMVAIRKVTIKTWKCRFFIAEMVLIFKPAYKIKIQCRHCTFRHY